MKLKLWIGRTRKKHMRTKDDTSSTSFTMPRVTRLGKRHGRLFINLDLISNHLMWPCVIPTVDGSHYQNEQKAEYLFSKHWSNEAGNGPLPFQDNIGDHLNCDPTPFTADELDMVLKNSKSNKQPGPDRMPMELFKWLNRCNRSPLLRILNNWWTQGEVPQEILHARVVPIFKKGNIDDPSNYRPISLLNRYPLQYPHVKWWGPCPTVKRFIQ